MKNRTVGNRLWHAGNAAFCCMLAFNIALATPTDAEVGLVLEVQGDVSITRGNHTGPIADLTYLHAGEKLALSEKSKIVATIHSVNATYTFSGPVALLVTKDGIGMAEGRGPKVNYKSSDVRPKKDLQQRRDRNCYLLSSVCRERIRELHRESKQVELAGMRMQSVSISEIDLAGIWPRNEAILVDSDLIFRWPSDSAQSFRVAIKSAKGGAIAQAEVAGNTWKIPMASALRYGERYSWVVQTADSEADGRIVVNSSFSTLSKTESENLLRLKRKSRSSIADAMLYALALDDLGLTSQADEVYQRIEMMKGYGSDAEKD